MTDSMLPMLRQLYDADGDRERADILLRMPDSVLLKYRGPIVECCRRGCFEVGLAFIDLRISLLLAVRDGQGCAPADLARVAERYRETLAAFAAEAAA
ncbi:hypothetical protein [Mesorhizobium sp. B1-1-2]|uniref:hypothetical protein n=1 Tax=Mesorhizobium sp. B1-1-2 TaxID=2589982 RepID=UPI00112DE2B1|nr:hypothetical protein [Mesorhizobium sp. B1-1-2]TPN79980.1 hypothetical protein FJ985_01745 [Mesorhizobium sp. B1-1-2]